MVIATCVYILTRRLEFSVLETRLSWSGFAFINMGLITMGSALTVAGLLQTYLWRVAGADFMEVQILIRPFLALRAVGGAVFAGGGSLFVLAIFLNLIRQFKRYWERLTKKVK